MSTPEIHTILRDVTRELLLPVRRFPERLRDRRFWHVQLMVLGATVPHYVIEIAGFTNPFETFHGLAITLYVLPLLYAALSFGWEGAILTAIWAAVLTSPSMWFWHRSGYHWLTEVGQLAITLPAGVMVAWRVDLETKQRLRAERTSASLSLLNEIGEQLGHRLEVEQVLPAVIREIRRGLPVDAAWLCMDRSTTDGERIVCEPPGTSLSDIKLVHRAVKARREPVVLEGRLIGVPFATEHGLAGSLGVALPPRSDAMLVDERTRVLAAAAHEISVAIENAGLYRERQESLQTYARQVTHAQEEERLRIARELHDGPAQELVHLVRGLERLGECMRADHTVQRQVDDLLELTRGTLGSVRRFSRNLRPSVLDDLGLVPAIELAVEGADARLERGAKLVVTGQPRRLGPDVELALFRIAQEALHNVEKHAGPASARVELSFMDACVRLAVSDDGRGFEPPARMAELGAAGKLGILGMKERAQLVGGRFEVQAADGRGSRISVTVDTDGPS